MRKLIAVALLLVVTTTLTSARTAGAQSGAVAAPQTAPQELQPGKPVERTINLSETHAYAVRLEQNQYLNLVAEQRGVDVIIRAFAPDGTRLGQFDSPNGAQGPEPVAFVAPAAGTYRIEVAPLEWPGNVGGRYEIKLVEVRAATKAELERVRTERELAQVEREWNAANERRDMNAVRSLAAPDYANFQPYAAVAGGREQFVGGYEQDLRQRKDVVNRYDVTESVTRVMGDTAVVTGRYSATVTEAGRASRYAQRFVHVWARRDGRWQIVGDLVYPAEPTPRQHTAVKVDAQVLDGYAGRYISDENPDGPLVITRAGDNLAVEIGAFKDTLYPEGDSVFFSKMGDVQVTFVRNARGEVTHIDINQGGRAAVARRVK